MTLKYKRFLFKEQRITKIAMCFYMLFLIFIPYSLKAQVQYLNISKDQTATVNQVFDLIKKQTDYHFIYKSDLFNDIPKVSLKKGQIGVKALLEQILPADRFELKFKGTTIVINAIAGKEDKEVESIGEVVITGYQTIDKKQAVGSFQVLKPKDFDKVASLNIARKLEGAVLGVKVDRFGNIVIRGVSTFNASSTPLIVVDGFPYNGGIYGLNTSDIAQVTVLKDAAATAVYGIKGANGVIVITTKGGNTHGKLNINYTSNLQVGTLPKIKDLDLMNSKQYIDLEWEVYQKYGIINYPWYNFKSEVGEIYAALKKGSLTQAQADEQLDELRGYNNAKDIEKYFLQRRIIQRHNLSLQYGADKNQFYASMTFDKDQSNYVGNQDKNYSFNLKDRFKFNRWAVFSLQSYGNYRIAKQNGLINISTIRPYVRFLDKKGSYVNEAHGSHDSTTYALYEDKGLLSFSYNRLLEQRLMDNQTKSHQVTTNFNIEISPFKWAKLTASMSYNIGNQKRNNNHHKESFYVRSFINYFTDENYQRIIPYGNILDYNNSNTENLTLRTQLNLDKTYKGFLISFIGGLERNLFRNEHNSDYRLNYNPQRVTESTVINWKDLYQPFKSYDGTSHKGRYHFYDKYHRKNEDRYLSSYMNSRISYKDKYLLSGSYRLDKTNLFGRSPQYRNQPSWSVGALWHLSQEDFFKADFIDRLSLKVSYGVAGNIDKSTSPYLIIRSSTLGAIPSATISNPPNPLLGWEKSYTFDAGMDFALLNNTLSGSISYYNKLTKDVLADVIIDPTTGFESGKMNNGKISNQGVEANLSLNILDYSQFKYGVELNFTYNYNEVKSVDKTRNFIKGKPLKYLWGFRYAGLDKQGEPQVYDRSGKAISFRGISYLKDGIFLGSTTAPIYGSLTHYVHYKNVSAQVFFIYNLGHKIDLYSPVVPAREFGSNNVHKIYANRWKKPGDETFARIPKLTYGYDDIRMLATYHSDFNIDNADFVLLKSITFTYDFTALIHSKKIKSLKANAGVENLWHYTVADDHKIHYGKYTQYNTERGKLFPEYINFTLGITVQF